MQNKQNDTLHGKNDDKMTCSRDWLHVCYEKRQIKPEY